MELSGVVVDLDGTIALKSPTGNYEDCLPNGPVIERLREFHEAGVPILIHTARNMRTYAGDLELIRINTLPVIEAWLARHGVPYAEVIIGKPWPGSTGIYVDDRSLRPAEFASMTAEEMLRTLGD